MSRLQNQLPPGQRPPTPADKSTDKPRRKRVRLPFEPRQTDPGQWSYDHRAGIAITLILYLIAAIAFMWGKIELGPAGGVGTILVEFPEEKLPTTLTPEQIRALTASDYDFSQVRNLSSNENAELNSELRDDRGTEASEIYDQADGLDDKMEANREAYEAGLARERDMIERSLRNRGSAEGTTSDSKVKGSVTVSFSFSNPVRNSVKLTVPAYRCQGGGEVIVNATLDNNGKVVSAVVDKALSAADQCMHDTATGAALSSRFNVDTSAPSRHHGTISYIFIPQ